MYTGVNDIMRQDHGPESSLGDTLLAVSLKALTTDQPSAELVTPTAGCEGGRGGGHGEKGCGGGRDEEGCGGEGREGGHGEGSDCQGRRSSRGLIGPRPGAVSGRGQEDCGSKWLAPRQPNVSTWVFGNLDLSSSLPLFLLLFASFSYYPFCPGPLPPVWPP
jgi:hypothetical protein